MRVYNIHPIVCSRNKIRLHSVLAVRIFNKVSVCVCYMLVMRDIQQRRHEQRCDARRLLFFSHYDGRPVNRRDPPD